eukprot:1688482-Prymnesium_polylepis.1
MHMKRFEGSRAFALVSTAASKASTTRSGMQIRFLEPFSQFKSMYSLVSVHSIWALRRARTASPHTISATSASAARTKASSCATVVQRSAALSLLSVASAFWTS